MVNEVSHLPSGLSNLFETTTRFVEQVIHGQQPPAGPSFQAKPPQPLPLNIRLRHALFPEADEQGRVLLTSDRSSGQCQHLSPAIPVNGSTFKNIWTSWAGSFKSVSKKYEVKKDDLLSLAKNILGTTDFQILAKFKDGKDVRLIEPNEDFGPAGVSFFNSAAAMACGHIDNGTLSVPRMVFGGMSIYAVIPLLPDPIGWRGWKLLGAHWITPHSLDIKDGKASLDYSSNSPLAAAAVEIGEYFINKSGSPLLHPIQSTAR